MSKKLLFLLISFFPLTACADDQTATPTSPYTVEKQLQSFLLSRHGDFQITEIFSKTDNEQAFIKKSLGAGPLKEARSVNSSELLFKPLTTGTETHLGIAVISYPDPTAAQMAAETIDPSGYFENTKIMTRYIRKTVESSNIILYTESGADKEVAEFMKWYAATP